MNNPKRLQKLLNSLLSEEPLGGIRKKRPGLRRRHLVRALQSMLDRIDEVTVNEINEAAAVPKYIEVRIGPRIESYQLCIEGSRNLAQVATHPVRGKVDCARGKRLDAASTTRIIRAFLYNTAGHALLRWPAAACGCTIRRASSRWKASDSCESG